MTRRGLSTFLAEHEDCGGGFEVQRREGSSGSIVRVVCGGCGQPIEYPAASDDELAIDQPASRSSAERMATRRRVAEGRPTRNSQGSGSSTSEADEGESGRGTSGVRSVAWRSWLPGLIAGLIGGALVLIVLAIASGGGSNDESTPANQSAGTGTPTAPPTIAPTSTTPEPVARQRPKSSNVVTNLDQRRLADRVSIGVPRGWSAGVSGGAVTLVARNGRAEVQVYYEPGAKSETDLMQGSKTFLLQRHPGARVAHIGSTDADGRQAKTVRVRYAGGTESATVLVAGGYSYLILERLGKPSSREARRTTEAVAMSFRPVI